MYLHNLSDYNEIVIILAHTFHYAYEISGLVWYERANIWCKLLEPMWEALPLRFHTPPGNPLVKKFLMSGHPSYDSVTRKLA